MYWPRIWVTMFSYLLSLEHSILDRNHYYGLTLGFILRPINFEDCFTLWAIWFCWFFSLSFIRRSHNNNSLKTAPYFTLKHQNNLMPHLCIEKEKKKKSLNTSRTWNTSDWEIPVNIAIIYLFNWNLLNDSIIFSWLTFSRGNFVYVELKKKKIIRFYGVLLDSCRTRATLYCAFGLFNYCNITFFFQFCDFVRFIYRTIVRFSLYSLSYIW